MKNIFELENRYLEAKAEYYNGTPIMTDAEFDALEKYLKDNGSDVVKQVGKKMIDFDFRHPTRMLSLSKIQTEDTDVGTSYMEDVFAEWYKKREKILGMSPALFSSPKFDGNAINVVYVGTKLSAVFTRGDGTFGNNVTKKFAPFIPNDLSGADVQLEADDILEIRCEVVIPKSIFEDKYSEEFANPRNYVAGVIRNEEDNTEQVSELVAIPLHFILNGKHIDPSLFNSIDYFERNNYYTIFDPSRYKCEMMSYEALREVFPYQLDGVVLAFPVEHRSVLGENSHDPEWSIAIKFVPEEAITQTTGINYYMGKTGELTPVIDLDPVKLAGTTVRKVSGYNYGYIKRNRIGKGSVVSVAKAGDIIPEIQRVIVPAEEPFDVPTVCPYCGEQLVVDDIHLMCVNENCSGRNAKKLLGGARRISLRGIGPKTLQKFAKDFSNMIELICWARTSGSTDQVEKYGIKNGSRSHELFIEAFSTIRELTYSDVLLLMGEDNVGRSIAEQVSNHNNGLDYDFSGLDSQVVTKMLSPELTEKIENNIAKLVSVGVDVVRTQNEEKNEVIKVCLTGSPKTFGYSTKKDFLHTLQAEIEEVSITDKSCAYLVTDSLSSTSSKMQKARKRGVDIVTYEQFEAIANA